MFMASKNLNITDYAVSRAIMELHECHDLITAQMIATKINGERRTVYRSIKRLTDADMLQVLRGSSRGGGYAYKYVGQ